MKTNGEGGKPYSLLWIDDDCHSWAAVKEAFDDHFETLSAESFLQAQQLWELGSFDCVVVDLYLPYKPGEVSMDRYVGIAALRSILERHGEKVLAAMVLSVTIPERIDAELKELRAKWTQVVFVASSKSEAVMQGLDQFVRGLKHAVDERAKAAPP